MTERLDYQKLSQPAVRAIGGEAGERFTTRERAALQWAEELTHIAETHASDEAFAAVSAEFQPKEVSDLTIAIGLINLFNRLAIGLRRPLGS